MPNSGQGTKDVGQTVDIVKGWYEAIESGGASKKKRPRQRNRVRNKNYKSPVATGADDPETASTPLQPQSKINPLSGNSSKQQNTLPSLQSVKNNQHTQSVGMKSISPKESLPGTSSVAKSREQVIAEREAKKLAKQAKKSKTVDNNSETTTSMTDRRPQDASTEAKIEGGALNSVVPTIEKSRDQVKAEREAKKLAKHAAKVANGGNVQIATAMSRQQKEVSEGVLQEEKKKSVLTKAERRAIQEAQRAAKAQAQHGSASAKTQKLITLATSSAGVSSSPRSPNNMLAAAIEKSGAASLPAKASKALSADCNVMLFNHLECARKDVSRFINNPHIHPSIARLGEQYSKRTIVGSNARCIAFLSALKMVVQDFETPPKKEFSRSLEVSITNCVEHLQQCRPLAVSVSNAYKHIKHVLTQLPSDKPESELKEYLCHLIETYVENQIEKAAQAISSSMQEKISDGDVLLTFGCSSLINYICEEAHRRHVKFRVIVVDSRPFCEGQELLRRLTAKEIPCTYVLINAVGFVMPEATKVVLGAHALLSNGYVMARTGTAQVALVARSFNVPVLVCCETHKFSERFQTDAIVYNELGNPDDLILSEKCCLTNWKAKGKMTPLNLIYDITPPELVTAVLTEVSILPCTSVPVILRIKPTEIGYYS